MKPSKSGLLTELQKTSSATELAVIVKSFEKGVSALHEGVVVGTDSKTLSIRLEHTLRRGQRVGLRINISERLFDAIGIGAGADADAMVLKSMGEVIKEEEGRKTRATEHCYTIRLIGPFSIDQEKAGRYETAV